MMKKFLTLTGIIGALSLPGMAQTWAQFDLNNDGVVSFQELRRSGVKINSQIRGLDRNNDRHLSHWETRNVQINTNNGYYGTYPQNYNNSYYQQQYYNTMPSNGYHWSTLDSNRNGVLENWELNQAGYQTNNSYNMYTLDVNRDGYIDQYEMSRAQNGGNTGAQILNGVMQFLPLLIR